jgi:NADPH:quinone reductase-like Zn-dependent oxidoreductase
LNRQSIVYSSDSQSAPIFKGLNMKVTITKRGAPSVLSFVVADKPIPKANEICIKVSTAGVAFADTLLREGAYPGFKAKGSTPGYDVVGTVEATGSAVQNFKVGDKVVALTEVGGYAHFCIAPAHRVAHCPSGLNDVETVAMVLNYVTAYQMLTHITRVKTGDTILIHGAAGGVGTALIQLCQTIGDIKIYGTASKKKHAALIEMGVTPIDYRQENFVEVMREHQPQGVDMVFDAVGGKNWKQSYSILRAGGMLIAYGFSSMTKKGRFNLPSALKSLANAPFPGVLSVLNDTKSVMGYNIRAFINNRPETFQNDMAVLLLMLKSQQVKPVIAKVLPLSLAQEAHELLAASAIEGKIVLQVNT